MSKRCIEECTPSSFPFVGDIIALIVSFLCVKQEPNGEYYAVFMARTISCVNTQRCVCRQFRDAIDNSLFLWQHLLGLTRRGSIRPIPLTMPKSVIDIKAFIPLDSKEHTTRRLVNLFVENTWDDSEAYCVHIEENKKELDYTKVELCRINGLPIHLACIPETMNAYSYGDILWEYAEIIRTMNKLCGITQ